jgi:type IV pilus assembly protein PilX
MTTLSKPSPRHQQGAVLAISLIILLLMTIIGVSAMQSTTLQEKMAGNLRDSNLAFQAAETALRDAENYLFNTVSLPSFSSTCTSGSSSGLCLPAAPNDTPQWKKKNASNVTYWNDDTKTRRYGTGTGATSLPTVSKQPRTLLEELVIPPLDPSDPPTLRYRITAQGYGAAAESTAATITDDETVIAHARVMLQTIVQR